MFSWDRKEPNGDVLHYYIAVSDSIGFRGATGRTILGLNVKIYSTAPSTYVPTEDELGAPIYRNAKYVPEESTKSASIGNHAFVSGDDLKTVVAFFEKELHVKANNGLGLNAGETTASFRNFSGKHPDNWIAVEQEQFQGRPRVRILYACMRD
jgi:hypothetical protein